MSSKRRPPNDDRGTEIDEELVAYLDNELSTDDALRIERRLSEDPDYRRRLQQLEKAWDLLDTLPKTRADDRFMQSTMTIVAQTAASESRMQSQVARGRRWWLATSVIGGMLTLALVGFLVAFTLLDSPNRRLLRNLEVIENMDEYRYADSVGFLEMLEKERLFTEEDEEDPGESLDSEKKQQPAQGPRNMRARIQQMKPAQVEELRRKQLRFARLQPEARGRLTALHAAIKKHSGQQDLRQILDRYSQWLRSLPAGKRAELLALPRTERLAKIKSIISEQEAQRFLQFATTRLAPEDYRTIVSWMLNDYLKRHEAELTAKMPEDFKRRLEQAGDSQRRWMLLGATSRFRVKPAKLTAADIEDLSAKLAKSAKEALANAKGLENKSRLVREWIRAAVFSRRKSQYSATRRAPDPKKLLKFYGQLSDETKEYLNGLPGTEMKRELQRMYFFNQAFRGGRSRGFGSRGGGSRTGRGAPRGSRQPTVPRSESSRTPDAAQPCPAKKDGRE